MKNLFRPVMAGLLFACVLSSSTDATAQRRGSTGVVFVTSQGLYYDTFVPPAKLPPVGPFQQLVMTPEGSFTEFGPGDPSYVGGRWWVDTDGDGVQEPTDMFFLCPLLGPGRETP